MSFKRMVYLGRLVVHEELCFCLGEQAWITIARLASLFMYCVLKSVYDV